MGSEMCIRDSYNNIGDTSGASAPTLSTTRSTCAMEAGVDTATCHFLAVATWKRAHRLRPPSSRDPQGDPTVPKRRLATCTLPYYPVRNYLPQGYLTHLVINHLPHGTLPVRCLTFLQLPNSAKTSMSAHIRTVPVRTPKRPTPNCTKTVNYAP